MPSNNVLPVEYGDVEPAAGRGDVQPYGHAVRLDQRDVAGRGNGGRCRSRTGGRAVRGCRLRGGGGRADGGGDGCGGGVAGGGARSARAAVLGQAVDGEPDDHDERGRHHCTPVGPLRAGAAGDLVLGLGAGRLRGPRQGRRPPQARRTLPAAAKGRMPMAWAIDRM